VQGISFRVYCRLKCFWPKTKATGGETETLTHEKSLAGRVRVAQVLWSEPYLWGVVLVRKHDSSVKRNQINGIGVTMGISLVNHDPTLACGFKIGSIALQN